MEPRKDSAKDLFFSILFFVTIIALLYLAIAGFYAIVTGQIRYDPIA